MPGDIPKDNTNFEELEELSNQQKFEIEALIDYIATTPQNINYNIVREIIKAVILNEIHPYFDHYFEKINNEESEESEPADKDASGVAVEGPSGGEK